MGIFLHFILRMISPRRCEGAWSSSGQSSIVQNPFAQYGVGARLGRSMQLAIVRLFLQIAIMFRYAAGGFRLLEIRFLATGSFGISMARFLTVMIRVPGCVRAPRIPRGRGPRAGSALVLVSQFYVGRYFFPFASLRRGCPMVTRQCAAF